MIVRHLAVCLFVIGIFLYPLKSNAKKINILVMGNSHSTGSFGSELDRNLRTLDNVLKVGTFASCGSIARWWWTQKKTTCGYYSRDENKKTFRTKKLKTPNIKHLFKKIKPNLTIVELGWNYDGYKDKFSISDMKKLATYIKSQKSKCIWVGPPDSLYREKLPRMYKMIDKAVSDHCIVINSSLHTKYHGPDGVHYYGKKGIEQTKIWAKHVFKEVRKQVEKPTSLPAK